jgi:hypothetical protein
LIWLVLLALVLLYFGRAYLAKRARAGFCADGCVTLALRLQPKKRGLGWKHGYARRVGNVIEWRAETKLGEGADLSFDVNNLHVTEHRKVVKGETMLSELCELVFALYQGEPIELGVPQDELPAFLEWVDAA